MNKDVTGTVCNGKNLETISIPAVPRLWGPNRVWKIKAIFILLRGYLHFFTLIFLSVHIMILQQTECR